MRDHVTHHDDCGCQSAALQARIATLEQATELDAGAIREHLLRIATLEAELAEARANQAVPLVEMRALQAHASALRDALESALVGIDDRYRGSSTHASVPCASIDAMRAALKAIARARGEGGAK